MRETCTSGSMSGEGKRSDGQWPPVTAPLLDSTPTMLQAYRTSQRLGSSRTGLLSVSQALAEKKQTATVLSRCSVTTNASRFSLTSPRTNETFLISKPRPIRLLNDCCSCASDVCATQTSAAPVTNDLTMVPPR